MILYKRIFEKKNKKIKKIPSFQKAWRRDNREELSHQDAMQHSEIH